MPEGDTVWRTARTLHAALAGQQLEAVDIRWGRLDERPLRGTRVLEVLPRGKHLLHRVDSGWTLHTHLRMEGSWRVEATGSPGAERGLRRPDLRVALLAPEWTVLGLALGEVDLVRTKDEHRLLGHLGPDILDPGWDAALAGALIRRAPVGTTVAGALLDQRRLCGVGTFWASEALFLERMHPWRAVADLDGDELAALLARVRLLMLRGREHAVQSSTGSLRRHERAYVHGRSGRPCRRCGGTVRVARLGSGPQARSFFSCPTCQGGTAPTDDGRPQRPLGARRG